MKTKLDKYYYRDPWTVMKFKSRNRGILYNGRTKQYNFYSLSEPSTKDEDIQLKYKNVRPYPYVFIATIVAALGISLAYNIIKIF